MARTTRGYSLGSPLENIFPEPIVSTRNPTANDTNYELGQVWVNTNNSTSYILNQLSGGTAAWTQITAGTSDVDTINGLAPVAGNIVIAGGTNLTDVNAGNTVTLNLDDAITLATSVTSPIYTVAAATVMNIRSAAGQNIILRMGDNAAANRVSFQDSDNVEVFSINSDGGIPALGAVTINGLLTANASAIIATAGTALNLATDNSGDAVNIGTGTAVRAIGIGNAGGVAHTVAIGAAAAGNISVNAGAGTLLLDSSGVLELNSSGGVISIGNDAVAQNMNIGTGAAARTVTIGNVTGGTTVNINAGTGGIGLASTGTGDITINSDDTLLLDADGVLELNSSAGVISIGNDADAQNINIGTGGAARTITVGNGTGATSLVFDCGTGALNVGTNAIAHTVTIGNVTGATSVVVDVGTGNADFGVSATAHATRAGSTTGASATTVQSGTGGVIVNAVGAAAPVTVDAVGVLELNSSAGVIGIGNDAVAQNINIGTGGAARTITVGNGTGATSLVFDCGTGALNIGTNAIAHTVTIGNATGATSVVVDTGTGNLDLGVTATAHTSRLGSTTGASATTVQSGTGGIAVNATGAASTLDIDAVGQLQINSSASTIDIGNDAVAQNMNIGTGGAARTITIGNATGATSVVVDVGTGAANFGTSATAHATTVGSTTGASASTLQSGTGGIAINATGAASTLDIDAVGALQINSSASTIGIGNDAVAQAMNIGTGAAARTVTIGNATGASSVVVDVGTGNADFGVSATAHTTRVGSTTGASALTLQAGTGEITMTGTVKEVTSEFTTRSGDFITFTQSPILQSNANTGVAPTGATGDVNLMSLQEGAIMEQFIMGAGQTIIAPRMNSNGLLVSLDLTATEGAEYNFGAARTNSRHAFTIGTSAAFFYECRFRIGDMSGADPIVFGFRRSAANNATMSAYTDYACIGMNQVTSATEIVTITELNAGGQTITNTTDLWGGDGTTNTLRVLVSAAGVVTYTINGVAPTVAAAFTFDNGDVVCPYFHFLHGAAAPGAIEWVWMKIGFQA